MNAQTIFRGQSGVTLIEVLVTILILAFGLIGLVGLQVKVQGAQAEGYQRAQAVLLVQDMANRLSASRVSAASYVTASPLGTGDSQPASCTALTGASRDQCEWSHAIQGAAEVSGANSIGAMLNARGCISKLATNPDVYRIAVAWQGAGETTPSSITCGQGSYTSENLRRAIAATVTIANLSGT